MLNKVSVSVKSRGKTTSCQQLLSQCFDLKRNGSKQLSMTYVDADLVLKYYN